MARRCSPNDSPRIRSKDYLTPGGSCCRHRLAPLHDIRQGRCLGPRAAQAGALTPEEPGRDAEASGLRTGPSSQRRSGEAGARRRGARRLRKTSSATHHEWWDGTGYPRGLKGTDISHIAGRTNACRRPPAHARSLLLAAVTRGNRLTDCSRRGAPTSIPPLWTRSSRCRPVLRDLSEAGESHTNA